VTDFKGIPIETHPGAASSPFVDALLRELQTLLEALVDSGEQGSIDLKSLPMGPGDSQRLRMALGEGEVTAVVQALGPTRVAETGFPGVWWVTHYNVHDEVVAERIEVTSVPAILESPSADVAEGLQRLRSALRGNA
jgi:hydrogenase-1 operon protein HyaF